MILENKHPYVIISMRMVLIAIMKETDHSGALDGDRLAKLLAGEEVPARIRSALWVILDSLRQYAPAGPQ